MKTIVIDDEPWMLRHFESESGEIDDIELLKAFRNPLTALEFAKDNCVELAFVDIEMPQLNGIETAERLKTINPEMKIVFISAFDEDVLEGKKGLATAFLHKPYARDELMGAVSRAAQTSGC